MREKLRQKVTKTDRHREQQARGGLEGSRYGERKDRGSGEHTSNSPLSSPTLYRCVGLKQLTHQSLLEAFGRLAMQDLNN